MTAYYINTKETLLANMGKLGLWLGCVVFIVFFSGGTDWLEIAITAIITVYFVREFVLACRRFSRPLIILDEDHFQIGRPAVSVSYGDVAAFAFDGNSPGHNTIAFSLIPRPGVVFPKISGHTGISRVRGHLVCARVALGRSVGAVEFYADFQKRLRAAQAESVFADQNSLAEVDILTGEVGVMKKGRLAALLKAAGGVNRDNALWGSFVLGAVGAVFAAAEVFAMAGFLKIFGFLGPELGDEYLWRFLGLPLIAVAIFAFLLAVVLDTAGRLAAPVNYMEKAGELKKFLLGVATGLIAVAVAAIAAIM